MVRCRAIFYDVESGFRDVELTSQRGHDACVHLAVIVNIAEVDA